MNDRPAFAVAFNHVGIGVADIDAAIAWYCDILGMRLISGPVEVSNDRQAQNVLGSRFGKMRQAHLSSINGIGIEFFQSIEPPFERRDDAVEFWKSGVFHICVTHPDVEELADRIVASGGALLSAVWDERGGDPNYKMCYCRDPFGTVIEIYSHSYELLQGHR
ncbi:VOC family protein [Mesorhizobium australicum]|uniref:VOC family protein n=1 Tax=Mesorhizobium australicum TaxID=536018 RepID=UPI00333DBE78